MNILWRLSWRALTVFSTVNRFFARRFTLAGRILWLAAGFAALLGVDTERSMTYQAFTLCAAFVMVGWAGALRLRPTLRVARELPRIVTAGETFSYTIRLENVSARSATGLVVYDNIADPRPSLAEFCRSGPPPDARSWLQRSSGYRRWRWLVARRENATLRSVAVDELQAAEVRIVKAQITPRHRGHIRFASIMVARPDVLGIAQSCTEQACEDNVIVLPRRYRIAPLTLPGARRYQHGGVAFAGSVGDSEEFLALRAYRPGDPLQRVHWKSFARVGEPVVKEYQDEFFERHALILDTFGGPHCAERFEEAVSVAASLAFALDTRESLLDLMFVGDRPYRITAGRGVASATRLLEALAGARLSGPEGFETLARSVHAHRAHCAAAIMVLLAWDEVRARFVSGLRASGVQVLVWVIVEPGTPLPPQAPWLRVLEMGRIEEALARSGRPLV